MQRNAVEMRKENIGLEREIARLGREIAQEEARPTRAAIQLTVDEVTRANQELDGRIKQVHAEHEELAGSVEISTAQARTRAAQRRLLTERDRQRSLERTLERQKDADAAQRSSDRQARKKNRRLMVAAVAFVAGVWLTVTSAMNLSAEAGASVPQKTTQITSSLTPNEEAGVAVPLTGGAAFYLYVSVARRRILRDRENRNK